MKETLGTALYVMAGFFTIGDAFIARMAAREPEDGARAVLRSALALGIVVVVVLAAAGWEMTHA